MITKVIYIFMLALLATPASSLYGETSTIDPSAQVDISATNPLHPGLDGGAFFVNGTLSCRQLKRVCTPGLRNLQRVGCKWINVTAPDGAACDVYRCIQGMCWQGVCMGGAPATCPAHKKECMQYKCNWKTGNCSAAVSKPDWSSCKGGYCQAGVCKKQANACSPLLKADKCRNYFLSMTTDQCTSVATQCTQRPPDACKMLRCNNNTGLCTTLVKRPDNTICPGGRCQSGECKTNHPLSTSCPAHTNTCKVLLYDPVNGTCTNEVKKLERTTCPGGTCNTGVCRAAAQCPTECPTHLDDCKAWECNLATGACTVEVIKPDNTSCPGAVAGSACRSGMCLPPGICPTCNTTKPHKDPCKTWDCDRTTGLCSIENNKPDNSPCYPDRGFSCCSGGSCLWTDPPPNDCMNYTWNASGCNMIAEPMPEGTSCDRGVCNSAGACIPFRDPCTNMTCPPHKELCKAWACDAETGSCTNVVNKTDKSPCNQEGDGTCCIGGMCLAALPPVAGPCMTYVWNQTTCGFTPKPESDGKPCSGGVCTAGVCGPTSKCPSPCPVHTDICKVWECNNSTNQCTIEVNKPDKSPCTGGGCCVAGGCLFVDPPAPGPCMTYVWNQTNCNFTPKPQNDGKTCDASGVNGTCRNGSCISSDRPGPCTNTICPPHKELCKAWACDADTGSCTIEANKPDNSSCTGMESGGGCCFAGACLAVDPPVSGPCMTNAWDPVTCTWAMAKPVPDGKLCSDGNTCTAGDACKAGTCTGNATAANGTQCTSGGCIGTCGNGVCGNPMMCP